MNDQKVFLAILLFSSMQERGVSAAPARTPPRPLWGYLSVAPPDATRMEVGSFAPGTLSLEQAVLDLDRKTTGRVVDYVQTLDAKQISTPVIFNPQTGRAARPLK